MGGGMRRGTAILLVDDDQSIIKATRRALCDVTHVIGVMDVDEGIAALRSDPTIGGLICDVFFDQRPRGFEVLDARDALVPMLPTLLLTGLPVADVREVIDRAYDRAPILLKGTAQTDGCIRTFACGCRDGVHYTDAILH
jgi:DNA-binding NtrC family response regulator